MRRLLVLAAAVAAGVLAKRAWEARHLPQAVAAGDGDVEALDLADDALAMPRGDDGVLGAIAMFDDHMVALAEMALNRPLEDAAQTLAAQLRDEHREHREHTRALIDRLALELAQDPAVAEVEAHFFARRSELAREDDAGFERAWLDAAIDDHERMLEFIDGALTPAAVDERVVEHLRMSRTHYESHLAEARMLA